MEVSEVTTELREESFEVDTSNVTSLYSPTNDLPTDIYIWTPGPRFIISVLFVIFGTIGNGLTIPVLNGGKFSDCSTAIYMMALAIFDILTLMVTCLSIFLGSYFSDIVIMICPIRAWLLSALTQISSWLIVAICVERVIAVCQPHKAKCFCTKKRARITTCGISALFLILNVHKLFTIKGKTEPSVCLATPLFAFQFDTISTGVLYSLLPSLIIVICNILIVRKVMKRVKIFGEPQKKDARVIQGQNITIMLVVNSSWFVILTLPYQIFTFLNVFIIRFDMNIYRIVRFVGFLCLCLNHSINFIFYALCGSVFRKEFLNLYGCTTSSDERNGGLENGAQETENTSL